MPRKALFDWERIRLEYETGSTMGELAAKHGVSKQAISKRAGKEGWLQNLNDTINRLASARVDGIVDTVNPKKKAEAVSTAASKRAEILSIHQQQWEDHRRHISMAVQAADFEAAKLAKITAETIEIVQKGERRAWGIDKNESVAPQADPVKELFKEIADAQRGKRLPEYTPPTESATDGSTTDKT